MAASGELNDLSFPEVPDLCRLWPRTAHRTEVPRNRDRSGSSARPRCDGRASGQVAAKVMRTQEVSMMRAPSVWNRRLI